MGICHDLLPKDEMYCSSHYSNYIAAVLIPTLIIVLLGLVYAFHRFRKRYAEQRFGPQEIPISTVAFRVSHGQMPFSISIPPEKPPSYEQSLQNIFENRTASNRATIESQV